MMNALTHWDSFKDMEELQSRFTKLFSCLATRFGDGGKEIITATEWAPSVEFSSSRPRFRSRDSSCARRCRNESTLKDAVPSFGGSDNLSMLWKNLISPNRPFLSGSLESH
jgi:hypothetical protein